LLKCIELNKISILHKKSIIETSSSVRCQGYKTFNDDNSVAIMCRIKTKKLVGLLCSTLVGSSLTHICLKTLFILSQYLKEPIGVEHLIVPHTILPLKHGTNPKKLLKGQILHHFAPKFGDDEIKF